MIYCFIVDVYNVLMFLSDNLLILREGNWREVWCVVNSNVVFVLIIIWYLGFINIISRVGIYIIFIMIMGNRIDNGKVLECRVLNNNK